MRRDGLGMVKGKLGLAARHACSQSGAASQWLGMGCKRGCIWTTFPLAHTPHPTPPRHPSSCSPAAEGLPLLLGRPAANNPSGAAAAQALPAACA